MRNTSILVIDPSVSNYENLLNGIVADVEAIVLDCEHDGVAQITELLSQRSGVESVHIVSHGSPGTLYLGNSELSLGTLERYTDQLQTWFFPSLLLYGCNVATGDAGAEFITKLHQLTGAKIAASTTKTGNSALGGNWDLEVTVGAHSVQTLAFQQETLLAYTGVLANTAPVLSNANVILKAINKGAIAPTGQVGTLISALVNLGTGGNVTDPDTNAMTGVAVTNVDTTNGNWFYSIDNGTNWTALGSVSAPNALLLAADTNTRVYFQPNANYNGKITSALTFNAWDQTSGSNGMTADTTTNGGNTAFSSTTNSAAITVNTTPVLSNANVTLKAINKGAIAPTGQVGTLVSALVNLGTGGNVTDTDTNALTGIAITSLDTTKGSWFYSTNNGSNWTALGSVSNTSALLLAADTNTRVYFQPNANYNGKITSAITFSAWDQTSGSNGMTADTTDSFTNAFSSTTNSATITVNTTPVLSNANVILKAINKGAIAPTGQVGTLVSSLVSIGTSGNVTDTDTNALTGIAITSVDVTKGSWFYSTNNGSNWTALGSVSNTSALLLAADTNTRVYFQPNANYNGKITSAITFSAWDQTSGSNGMTADTTDSFTNAFSSTTNSAAITVNTTPVLSNANVTLKAINKGAGAPTGQVGTLVSSLVSIGTSGNVTDTDTDALTGIAITSLDTTKGSWFYSTNNGSNWTALGSVSNTSALLLAADTNTRVYFQPKADFDGAIASAITFRAWDQTSGSNGMTTDTTDSFTNAFSSTTNTAAITVNNVSTDLTVNSSFTLKLQSKNVFQFKSLSEGGGKAKLKIKLSKGNSNFVNELGVCVVDDDQGKINGIAPGAEGYTQAALAKAKVVFSSIANLPNGFDNDLTQILEFNSDQRLRFFLVKNSSFNEVLTDKTKSANVFFSDNTSTQAVSDMGNGEFSLSWKDASNNSTSVAQDLVVNVKTTNEQIPLGTGLQGSFQGEVIDLRTVTSKVKAEFTVNREAVFNDYVGFYQVADLTGGIDINGDGKVVLHPGEAGYAQAAVSKRVAGVDLTVDNQGSANYTGNFSPGSIFAPFIIVNGKPDAMLAGNNNLAVYFPYLGANTDKFEHIRLLGSNSFGFEDLGMGGDKDFNDVTVRMNLSIV